MTVRGIRLLTAALVAFALGVTGCHGMRPPPGERAGGGAVSQKHKQYLAAKKVVAAIEADAGIAADVPADLKRSGLKVTTSPGYPPMEMFDDDKETIIGIDPSLARAIGKVLGLRVTVKRESFNAQIPGMLTGRYDMVMSSLTDNTERRAKATMIDYVAPGTAFVVQKGNPAGIHDPGDVCGKTLAVVDNGSALGYAQDYNKACRAKGKQPAKILKFTGDQDALLQVRSGRADADINDYPVAVYHAATSNGRLGTVTIHGTKSPFGIAMVPKRKAAIAAVRRAVQALIDSGAYAKILKAWGVDDMAVKRVTINGGS
ncbi:MAG: ABC transporter substrate-binding protein [Streptosporangiales bacterium]